MNLLELKLSLVIAILFLAPGWGFLSITGLWRRWSTLQRWCLAILISVAFYPVFYYAVRQLLPSLSLGMRKMQLILLVFAGITVFFQRKTWKQQLLFRRFDLYTILVISGTLLTRLWVAHNQPFPAWSDSLHHTILTQLTAENGRLPFTMEPYAPIPLNMYHLGLYSISGLVELLAGAPAHTALLWTAQALNGLCGLGVFLVLDQLVGCKAAFLGTAVVGFFSHMPAYYVNWGRFTQISSQTLLLAAWLVTYQAVRSWRELGWKDNRITLLSLTLAAALLNAGTFLFHFRVAGFYLPLLAVTLLWELFTALRSKSLGKYLLALLFVGVLSILLVSPALFQAASAYVQSTNENVAKAAQSINEQDPYFSFSLDSIFTLGVRPWLMVLTVVSLLYGLINKNRFTLIIMLWVALLWVEGNSYRFGIPLLNFTNMGAILIMLYLPASLLIAIAGDEGLRRIPAKWDATSEKILLAGVLFLCFVFTNGRVNDLEMRRFFLTEEDVQAMNWISANTPPDATFAVNTSFWLPNAPHGTDGGYWIPYFTRRKTTAGYMISNLGSQDYLADVVHLSRLQEQIEGDNNSIDQLKKEGVNYIYIGAKGDFSGIGIDSNKLLQNPEVKAVFYNKNITIFYINGR